MDNTVHIFGIRHHGPGSARSVRQALEALQPDVILVEGPPEAEAVLPLLIREGMKPPVALLLYLPDQPDQAVYYPFAVFSPEWQAMEYGLTQGIPVRFMDLPQSYQLGQAAPEPEAKPEGEAEPPPVRADPLGALAEAAGYSDGERWWEHLVEQRRDSADLFAAILEAMTVVRAELPDPKDVREERREAFMRQTIRAAQKEGRERIAVVCGAWHGPALAQMPPAKDDSKTLEGLTKSKVQATWVPWTYGRLSYASGYGAGIESPGWYHHLWDHPADVSTHWMARVAHLFREQDLDASPAHVIEGVRLADTLAALRGRPLPGLPELNEATQSIFCFGSDVPMRLIWDKLIVSETLGTVPDETPSVPLQQDLMREQKRLRLTPEAAQRDVDLDLRKPNDRDKSFLLHRLALLGIPWGQTQRAYGGKGTFHELWRLQWQPEFAVKLIEAGLWGNTVLDAASSATKDKADHAPDLPTLTTLLDQVLLAELPDAVRHLMTRLESEAALASDVSHLMGALPPLANVLRYGSVRQTGTGSVAHIVNGLVSRIAIGLPGACASLNDEAAEAMDKHVVAVHGAIGLLQDAQRGLWHETLSKMADRDSLHGLIAGRCVRLLLDAGALTAGESARRMGLALSTATDPAQAAAWVEGFLKGSGLLLLHDATLWSVLDGWVSGLTGDAFTALLPLLRRTFATFSAPERRQMGERAKQGPAVSASAQGNVSDRFDPERAAAVLPLAARLLGLEMAGSASV